MSFGAKELAGLSPDELADLAADCLSRLEPGRQPLPLFIQLSRLTVIGTFELTPFRSVRAHTEVLLAQRHESDPWWPSQWNLPGAVQLPTSQEGVRSYAEAADDVLGKEFRSTVQRTSPVTIFEPQLRTGPRGSEQTVFGLADVEQSSADIEPSGGRFFRIDRLFSAPPKEGLVQGHELTIQRALAHRAMMQT